MANVATVVSIQPFAVKEERPGLSPGEFAIPPGTPDEPQFLVVRKGQIRMMDQDFRPFMVDEDPLRIAKDVANGHCSSLIGYGPDASAGVFAVPGEVTTKEHLIREHKKIYDEYVKKQIEYFRVLIGMADDDWRRNKQLRHIGDLHRAAARFLSIDREWLASDIGTQMKCPACMSTVSTEAAVCFACQAILNEEKYKKLKFHDKAKA
jgi:hypothetical protein